MSDWRLRLFGGLALERGEDVVSAFGTARAAKLLALLAITPSGRLGRERLADQLWPDDFLDATRLRLRQEIYRLKQALGPAASLLCSTGSDVWIEKRELVTDLDLIAEAEAGGTEFPLETLTADFLPEWDDLWVVAERIAAEKRRDKAGIAVAQRRLDLGDAEAALMLAQILISRDPLDEDLRMIAVNAHAKLGSMASAMAEYQDLRKHVRERLGVEPSRSGEDLARELATVPSGGLKSRSRLTDFSIPEPTEELIGRETILGQVLSDIPRYRVVSLIGPGGIGKTRLAIEVARKLKAERTYTIAFASLAEVTDPTSWARSTLAQLGSDAPPEADPIQYLAAQLSPGPTLLILDNVEPILPAQAGSIQALLDAATDLRLVTTSIVPLMLRHERVIAVGALEASTSGVELLKQGLSASRLSSLSSMEEDLAEIARQLDGYPLALRLVSARLRLLSPRELLGQLGAFTSVANATDLPERHRSLRSAIEGTLASLSPATLDALHRVWAYPGGMGMGMAAVEFRDEGYLDLIESLLDSSLLVLEDHRALARVRLLAPVKECIANTFEQAKQVEARNTAFRRILMFLMETEIAPWRPVSVGTLERLYAEAENLIAAWTWAKQFDRVLAIQAAPAMSRFEGLRGQPHELYHDLLELDNHLDLVSIDQQIRFQFALVHAAFGTTRHEDGLAPLKRAESMLRSVKESELMAWLAFCFAAYAFRKDFPSAEQKTKIALAEAQKANDVFCEASSHKVLAMTYDHQRQTELVLPNIEAADALFRLCEADTDWCSNAIYYGAHLWYAGFYDRSANQLQSARVQLSVCPDGPREAYLAEIEGRLAFEQGDLDQAESALTECLRLWQAMGSAYQEADQLHSLTKVKVSQGKLQEAKDLNLRAAKKWVEDNNGGGLCCSMFILAHLLHEDGRTSDAAGVLAFARRFENESALAIVASENQFREGVEHRVGIIEPHDGGVGLELAYRYFDLIR
ncbi:MAG: BTAD domain-containing putative transcriptional regulator [Fimbriimonadaceae bacterium]